jgi:hypothetical protein
MKRIANRAEIKRDIPMFEDNAETEIDEVFDSIVWDLCGWRHPGEVRLPIRRRSPRSHPIQ